MSEPQRLGWDQTWRDVAQVIARRSPCVKAQVGAVIVDRNNRIIATGYNGQAAGDVRTCREGCPRMQTGDLGSSYSACLTIHAEANSLMFCDRRDREGGTIYISRSSCMDCAKLIANSGLAFADIRVIADDWYRNPQEIEAYLESCGIKTNLWAVK